MKPPQSIANVLALLFCCVGCSNESPKIPIDSFCAETRGVEPVVLRLLRDSIPVANAKISLVQDLLPSMLDIESIRMMPQEWVLFNQDIPTNRLGYATIYLFTDGNAVKDFRGVGVKGVLTIDEHDRTTAVQLSDLPGVTSGGMEVPWNQCPLLTIKLDQAPAAATDGPPRSEQDAAAVK